MRLPGCARTHSSSGLTHRSSWIGRVCVALIHSSASTTSQYPNSGTFGGGDIFDELGTCAAGRSLHIPTGTVLKRIPPTTPINRMTLSRIPSFFHCAICIIHLLEHDLVLFICLHDFLVSFLGPTVTAFWALVTYRLPVYHRTDYQYTSIGRFCQAPLVEMRGFEPLTSSVQGRRSPI